jgi:hypothetical protein
MRQILSSITRPIVSNYLTTDNGAIFPVIQFVSEALMPDKPGGFSQQLSFGGL